MLVAEELEVDWRKVDIEFAPADPAYANPIFKMQATGGAPASARSSFRCVRPAPQPAKCCAKRQPPSGACHWASAMP